MILYVITCILFHSFVLIGGLNSYNKRFITPLVRQHLRKPYNSDDRLNLMEAWNKIYLSKLSTTRLHFAEEYNSNKIEEIVDELEIENKSVPLIKEEFEIDDSWLQFQEVVQFLYRSAQVGIFTGIGVVVFKTLISLVISIFYEQLADILPKPAFYWPIAIYPILGSLFVCICSFWTGGRIKDGIDQIAKSIDSEPSDLYRVYDPRIHLVRLLSSVATLGSGCSLGPEGPAVEIGTGISRLISNSNDISNQQKHHLFLCGTAAAVSAGFNAPITGIFFAIECGNRYLTKNTIKLAEDSPDGPRSDIAGIVLAATLGNLISDLGLHDKSALAIQGNNYALNSPIFELSLYLGLGLISGLISVVFTKLREVFVNIYVTKTNIPVYLRPLIGGLVCGLVAIYFPQTLFVGYTTLDQILAGKITFSSTLVVQLLVLKIFLSSFCLASGLVGGVFAPGIVLYISYLDESNDCTFYSIIFWCLTRHSLSSVCEFRISKHYQIHPIFRFS